MAFVVPAIFKAIDKLSGPLATMGSNVSKFAKFSEESIAKTERKYRKLRSQANDIAMGSAGVGLAIAAPLALATKSAVDFEKQMSNVSTLVDTNQESMEKMGAGVLDVAKKIPVPLEELTASLYDIRSAGIPASEAMNALEVSAKLSKAGLATAAESTNIMTSAMNAFKSEGLSASQISDILFKTVKAGKTNLSQLAQAFGATAPQVQAAGVRLSEFQAATAALTTVGTPAAQAQNQIRAAVVALQKPTKEMDIIFKRLGAKSGTELIKKSGGLVGAMQAIQKEGTKAGLNMSKAWSSVEAFGSVLSLTGATNEAFNATLDDMTKGSNAVEDAFKKQAATGASQLQLAKNNMEALSITIGTQLIPVVNKLIKRIVPVFEKIMDFARKNPQTVKTIIMLTVGIAALSFAISAGAGAISLFSSAVLIATKLQAAWNLIMSMNPIGLVVLAIIALITYIGIAINYWDEFGASMMFLLGPIGLVISAVMTIKKHWDSITGAFTEGGFLEGIKAIGVAIFDMILLPIQQIVGLVDKIAGTNMAGSIEDFRSKIGVSDEILAAEKGTAPAIRNDVQKSENIQKTITEQRQGVTIDINDRNNNSNVYQTGAGLADIKLNSTMIR